MYSAPSQSQSSRAWVGSHPSYARTLRPRGPSTLGSTAGGAQGVPANFGGSFLDQLFALVHRLYRQSMRSKCAFCMEIFVPILFVLITLVLWCVWLPVSGSAAVFQLYSANNTMKPNMYQSLLCYKNINGTSIPGLCNCDMLEQLGGVNTSCDGDNSTIPFNNFCYVDVTIDMSGYASNGYSLGVVSGAMAPVQVWINSFQPTPFAVPLLDEVIAFQWLTRKSKGQDKDTISKAVGSGLVPNSKQTAIYCSGNLYFVGPSATLAGVVQYFERISAYFPYVNGGVFETVGEAEDKVRSTDYNWAIIEFAKFDKDNFDVNIRMNSTALPNFAMSRDASYAGGYASDRVDLYAVAGYLSLQQIITEYYVNYVVMDAPAAEIPVDHYFASMPYAKYYYQPLLTTAGLLLPFIFVLSFLYPVSQMTKRIVLEKELRIREAMHIMGLGNLALYLSWYLYFFLPNFIVTMFTCFVVKLTFLTISNVFIFFMMYYIYLLTCVPIAGFLSTFFSKARLASLLAPIIYFIFVVPVFAIQSASTAVITVFCIFPPTAFAVSLLTFVNHEMSGGFSTKTSWNDVQDIPPMYLSVVMMVVGLVFFTLLMLYMDAVMPKDWGTPKHPLFFIIDPIRWCCCKGKGNSYKGGADGRDPDGVFEDGEQFDNAIAIEGLRKVYKRAGKRFVAVNNLYWGMREGEISVMLGHNGAGKTTLLNMMTGMIEPDKGDCYIYGLSVRRELSQVRKQIGYCPQHNILWPELTCREHLEFYARLKGLKGWALEDAVCRMLYETDLLEKVDQPCKNLSGGQKRKLSVSIAFVTTSRLVFLDEPTAGMDVGARRYTWELLRRMSKHHTILLTTHYMDEADLLGHRIGIMSQGCLKCSGSSLFLKSELGVGYSITMSLTPDAKTEKITDIVLRRIDGAEELGINGCEAMYRLPNERVEDFPAFLDSLEARQERLGIRGYSLSATTLEEVFLGVSEEDIARDISDDPIMQRSDDVIEEQEDLVWNCDIVESRKTMLWSQFKAMMWKRLWNALRDRKMQCFQIVMPVVCILIAMLLSLISMDGPQTITLGSDMYHMNIIVDMNGCDDVLGDKTPFDGFLMRRMNLLNALNMSFYELDSFFAQPALRMSGLACRDPDFEAVNSLENTALHLINSSAYHQGPMALNAYYSAYTSNQTKSKRRFTLKAGTMPKTSSEKVASDALKTILMGAIIMIPFTFLPSNPVAWIVKERECKARHLQNVSGLSFYIYWISNLLFDIGAYIMTMLLAIIIFAIFNRREYIAPDRIGAVFTLFFIYGLSSTATGYLCSFAFNEHSMAQTVVMAVSFVTGFLLVMIVYMMSLMSMTQNAAKIIRWIARIMPSYAIGEGIINLAMLTQQQTLVDPSLSAFSMDVTGWADVYMAIEFPLFLLITLFIDHPSRRMWGQRSNYDADAEPQELSDEDSDVEEEREVVYENEDDGVNDDMVRVVDLRKVYPNGKEAVRNITFGVPPGEVFGFLGTNGAGKTTTISMLCQEFIPTSGKAYICGYSVVEDNMEALQCIGYCPQFDATLDLLTVQEHLELYAGVRGIAYDQRKDVVEALLRMCELVMYRKTLSAKLSGGNRRKLSFAMSLIGGPRVVFLDEPSAGMDPVARRGLWNAIEKVADNSSVILTTHHLEEVEALAHRVAIMVDGTLRCIGDKTHLKTKYGTGFEMTLRVSQSIYMDRLQGWVKRHFPDSVLNECKGQRFVYTLPANVCLSDVFRSIQHSQRKLHITDYSVSQTSIEQVFLKISGELEEANAFGRTFEESAGVSGKSSSIDDYTPSSSDEEEEEEVQSIGIDMRKTPRSSDGSSDGEESSSSGSDSSSSGSDEDSPAEKGWFSRSRSR